MTIFGIGFRGVLFLRSALGGATFSKRSRGVLNLFFGFRGVVYALHRRNNDIPYTEFEITRIFDLFLTSVSFFSD